MKCKILHESRGRLRVHLFQQKMTLRQADVIEYYLLAVEGIEAVKVFDRTADVIIRYQGSRQRIIEALSKFSYQHTQAQEVIPVNTGRVINREFEDKFVRSMLGRFVTKMVLPAPVRTVYIVVKAVPFIIEGVRTLLKRKLEVSVLDATAISVALVRRDFKTASSVMFMLRLGELLEEWTYKKSVDNLAQTMALNIEHVWLKRGDSEFCVPVTDVTIGDLVVIRMGNVEIGRAHV